MRGILLSLFVVFAAKICFAGCSAPKFYFRFNSNIKLKDTTVVKPLDFLTIRTTGGTCYELSWTKIYRNDSLIHSCEERSCTYTTPCLPGNYFVSARNRNFYYDFGRFVLVLNLPIVLVDSLNRSLGDTAKSLTIEENQNLNTELALFPNPAHDLLSISYNGKLASELRIIDMAGKIVLMHKMNSESLQIDLSRFAPGFYFVEILNQNAVLRKRLVIQ